MNMGIGAMLHALGGGSDEDPKKYYGMKITEAEINEDELILSFENGSQIKLWDDGQSCCESRYITCDDDVADLVGGNLRHIEVKKHTEKEDDWETHEICFIEVATDQNFITLETHNEHNGYYGGFGLSITELLPPKDSAL